MSRRRVAPVFAVLLALGVALVVAKLAFAAVTVTAGSGGTNLSADRAANATSPQWTTLGNIAIQENNNNDFASPQTNTTLILSAPSNWSFNAGVGTVSSLGGSRNITGTSISVTASTITVTISVSGTNRHDALTISGIQVQSTDGALLPNSGNILRTAANPGTATIAGITNGSTNFGSLSQIVGNRTKLGISTINGGSNPTAGAGFPVVVQSQDQFGNAANVVAATGVSLSLNTGTGTLGGTLTGTIDAGTNSATISGVTYTKAESGVMLTATRTSGDTLTAGNSAAFTVNPGSLDHFAVEAQGGGAIGTQTAGTSFDLRMTAQDSLNNTVTGYSSTVDISSTGTLSLGSGTTAAFSAGVLASHTVRISNTGSFTITATRTSGGSQSGTSNSFTVNPGTATKLVITAVPGPVAVGAGFSVTVQSQDANGNPSNVAAATGISLSGSGSGALSGNTDTIAAGTNTKALTGVSYDVAQTITLVASRTSGDMLSDSAPSSGIVFTARPISTITFPGNGTYNAAGWDAGCASAGLCGTSADNSGTGLATVELSIRRGGADYWDGDSFDSSSEVFVAASLAGSAWSYGFGSSGFPADDSYSVRVRATDNAGGVESPLPSQTFSYDATPPIGLTTTSPSGATSDSTPVFSGAAGTALGDSTSVTVNVYDSGSSLVQTRTAPVAAGSWLVDASPALGEGSYTATGTQTDAAGNSTTTGAIAFTVDTSPPAPPSLLGTSPASPANDNTPDLTGTAESGSTVDIFTTSDCSGAPVSTGSAATFGGTGIAVPAVSDNSSTTYYATARDAADNVSLCSSAITYVEDSAPPATPTGLATDPVSPANDNDPEVLGTAEAGATVLIFTSSDCSGAPAATGPTATFNSIGISVSVAANSSSTFKAVARDAAGNESGCSSGVAYIEDSTAPSSTVAFPAGSTDYNGPGWTAGCSPSGLCGTASDTGGSGLAQIEFSLRRDSNGLYWDGDDFEAGGESWVAASGTASWSSVFTASSFPADGDYTLRVRAVDTAANQEAPSSRTFTIDTAAPETQVDASPPDPTNSQDASFSFSSDEPGSTFECRLDTGSWLPCTGAETYGSLAEASHTFRVRATDAAGNVDATPALHTWTIDLTDPTVGLAFPNNGASYNVGSWNAGCNPNGICGTANDAGGADLQNVQVSVQRGSDGTFWNGSSFSAPSEDWQTASGTTSWSFAFPASNFPADEAYTVRARASDDAGNTSAPVARTFTIDGVPPQTTIDSGPPDPSNSASPSFAFSADEPGSTFECRLDEGSWAGCTSPESYSGLAQGSHSFGVRATDLSGNVDPTPASNAWVVDTIAPTGSLDNPGPYLRGAVTLTADASDTAGTGVASVTFQRAPAGSGTWTPLGAAMSAPYSFDWDTTSTSDDLYDLRVVIIDNATNSTSSLAATNVRVDNTPPEAVMDSPGENVAATVTLTHSSSDDGSGIAPASVQFEYRSNPAGAWTPTGASWDTEGLEDGLYDLRVSVSDRAGNTDVSSEETTRVDNTPPEVSYVSPTEGSYVNASSADPRTIVAAADDDGSGVGTVEFFACTDASVGCATGTWTSLGAGDGSAPFEGSWPLPLDGNQALKATATDNAAHTASAVVNVTVDRTVPDTTITIEPGDPSNVATPSFEFESDDAGATFECQTDGAGWSSCASPHTLASLGDGTHTFEVRAIDFAANVDASPAAKTWLVDTTPPNATMDDPGATLREIVALTSVTEDPGASASGIAAIDYEYSADGGTSWFSTPAAWDTTAVSDGLYAVRVVVSDNAGNVTESAPVIDRLVDNTPPATAIDDPGANLRQTVTLTGSATDEGGSGVLEVDFQYTATGGSTWTTISTDTGAPYDAPFDTASLADGLYDFRTVARDVAGNETEGTPVLSRRIDNTPPTATMNDPGANLRGTVTLSSVADDTGGSGVSSVVYEASPAGGGSWSPISGTWDTNGVADGVYDLHVVVTDAAGNETISLPVGGRRVDNTPPSTSDNAPGGWQKDPVTVTLSADDGGGSGVSNTQFAVDGGSYSSGTSVTIAAPSDGSNDGIHSISYFSTDNAGNIESSKTASVAIDATPPVPGADDPGTYLSGTVTLSAGPSDPNGIESVEFQYSDGSGWSTIGADSEAPYSAQWNTTEVSDGSYDLRVTVLDEAGNESTEDLPNKIVDNTAPSAGVGSPTAGATVAGNVSIGATALDANPITSVEFFVRGSSIGTANEPPFTRSWDSTGGPDGGASIYVVVTDIAGHSTTSGSISVNVDNFPPAVTLANPGSNGRGVVALSASADADAVQVSFERRPAGGGGWTTIATDTGAPWEAGFDTTLVADGMYDLRAIAVDGGSNSGTSGVHTLRVDNTLPSGSISAPGSGSTVGASVPVAANANDGGSGVAVVRWEYRPAGGGGYSYSASDSNSPYEGTWNASALASGAYEIRVVVGDAAGNEFTGAPITVTVDTDAPTVTLDDPGSPLAGTVTLSATAGGATTVTFAYSPSGANSWTNLGADTSAPWTRDFNTAPRPDGLYDLRATAADSAGNNAAHVRPGIRLDNRAPSIISSVPANSSIVASASSIELTASEEIDGLVGVTLDGAPTVPPIVSGGQATYNTGELPDGGHTLRGTVRDKASRTGSFSIFFTVGTPDAPPPTESAPPVGTPPVGTPAATIACLPPSDFSGKVGVDGTLTLRWKSGRTADGKLCDTILYADGVAAMSFPAKQTSANLGPFGSDDLRTFTLGAIGPGEPSQQTRGLRALPPIFGHTLAEATQMLAERAFEVGTVTGAGAVVVPAGVVLAPVRSLIELVLAEPQSKLIFQVVGTKRFTWSKARHVAARIKTTKPVRVTASLHSPRGQRLYRWRVSARAGASIAKLQMPRQVRRAGVYRLVFAASAGSDTVRRTIRFRLIGPKLPRPVSPGSQPVDIVLAGGPASEEIALGLDTPKTRVLEGNGDSTFDLTGDARRNVQVIVVDVDRYGVELARDLHIVFPTVRIVALSSDPRRLPLSIKAGATVALPKSTPAPKLVQVIRRLAYRP